MTDTDSFNNVYLDLSVRKSEAKTDENGNFIIELEASNENLDLQEQSVLQSALLESKEYFLKNGVISCDHLHKRKDKDGNTITDPSMIIGEPIDVKTEGKKTFVVAKLYAHNPKARDFAQMIKDGSTRVRGSVGGIFPKIIENVKNGTEKIVSVLWNDLALTTSPVNPTVGSATFAKSLSSKEFIKALSANYETDSCKVAGGKALVKEDVSNNTINNPKENLEELEIKEEIEKNVIRSLIASLKTKEIETEKEAKKFLLKNGISEEHANDILHEIIEQGELLMKKSYSETISEMLKSFKDRKSKVKKGEDEEDDNFELTIDDNENFDDFGDGDDDLPEENEQTKKSRTKKSTSNDDDDDDENEDDVIVDGTDVMKSLENELQDVKEIVKSQSKIIDDLGLSLTNLAKMVTVIGDEKIPPRSVMSKSFDGKDFTDAKQAIPTKEDLDIANEILCNAVKNNQISIEKSSLISADLQKSIATGKPMKSEYYSFLVGEHRKGEK